MNIITLKRPDSTGRYLTLRKRNYSRTDVSHPMYGFLCQLVSYPKGFRVSNSSTRCRNLEGTFHQTPAQFERSYLQGDK